MNLTCNEFSLLLTQIFGLILTLKGLPNDKELKELSGTYWDLNPHMLKHLISDSYDKLLGVFVITLPTLTAVAHFNNSYINFSILAVGGIACLPFIKNYYVNKKSKQIREQE